MRWAAYHSEMDAKVAAKVDKPRCEIDSMHQSQMYDQLAPTQLFLRYLIELPLDQTLQSFGRDLRDFFRTDR